MPDPGVPGRPRGIRRLGKFSLGPVLCGLLRRARRDVGDNGGEVVRHHVSTVSAVEGRAKGRLVVQVGLDYVCAQRRQCSGAFRTRVAGKRPRGEPGAWIGQNGAG